MVSYSGIGNQVRPPTAWVYQTKNPVGKQQRDNARMRDLRCNPCAATMCAMNTSVRVCFFVTAAAQLLVLLQLSCAHADEPPPTVIDSNAIVRSLAPTSSVHTRGLQIEPSGAASRSQRRRRQSDCARCDST